MVSYTAASVNNAGPDEYFYTLTSGPFAGAIVRIVQERHAIDLDKDGAPDQFNYKHAGAFVDSENNVLTNSAGVPWKTTASTKSLLVSAIAEGLENEAVSKGNWRAEWVQQTVNTRVAIGE